MGNSVQTLTGEASYSLGTVVHVNMRVPHCHPDVAVPGLSLDNMKWHPLVQQPSDMAVPAGSMKVGNTFGRFVGDPNPFQVLPNHPPGFSLGQPWGQNLVCRYASNPRPE
jgi:hypothetical protein